MRYSKHILIFVIILSLVACNGVKRKGSQIIDKTKQTASETKRRVAEKKNEIIDKVFPSYDNGKADTPNNKKRFREHLGVDLTTDIKNIYSYGDFMGIDYMVLIAFTCDQSTIDKIIAVKKMKLSKLEHDDGLSFSVEFPWWNTNKIESIRPYKQGKEYEYYEYLWYDPTTKEAYYEEFSM